MGKIEIFTTPLCVYCQRAKALLARKGVAFDEIDVSASSEKREEMIARSHGARTVPQIFINGQHIGNCDELLALDRAARLDPLLESAR